jgi:hypothetical protein
MGRDQASIATKGGKTMIATDPLSLVFIFCFLLGFGFFLATALMGGHHGHSHGVGHGAGHVHGPAVHHAPVHTGGHVHVHTHAHVHAHTPAHAHGAGQHTGGHSSAQHAHFSIFGYLNPISVALFMTGFGLFGYFLHNQTKAGVTFTLLIAILGGIALAVLLLLLVSRLFANVEGSTELDVVDRTGMLGKVSITIPEKGLGEIIYTTPSGLHKSIAARGLNNQRVERDQEVVVVNYQNGVAEVDTWDNFMHSEPLSSNPATSDELAQLRALLNASDAGEIEMVMQQEQQKE